MVGPRLHTRTMTQDEAKIQNAVLVVRLSVSVVKPFGPYTETSVTKKVRSGPPSETVKR
jgi:hypothetical protein